MTRIVLDVPENEKIVLMKLAKFKKLSLTQYIKNCYQPNIGEYHINKANDKMKTDFMKKHKLDMYQVNEKPWKSQLKEFQKNNFTDVMKLILDDFDNMGNENE
jgi:hypothetical protein